MSWNYDTEEVKTMYPHMKTITGITPHNAAFEDFQREFKCDQSGNRWTHNTDCSDKGLAFPVLCSFPPCDQCILQGSGR